MGGIPLRADVPYLAFLCKQTVWTQGSTTKGATLNGYRCGLDSRHLGVHPYPSLVVCHALSSSESDWSRPCQGRPSGKVRQGQIDFHSGQPATSYIIMEYTIMTQTS